MLKLPPHIVKNAKSNDLLVSVRIGKEGVTDSLIKELDEEVILAFFITYFYLT